MGFCQKIHNNASRWGLFWCHGHYGEMPSMGWEEVVGTGNGQEIGGTAAEQQLGWQRSSGASRTRQLSQTTLWQNKGETSAGSGWDTARWWPWPNKVAWYTDGSMQNHASSPGQSYGELNHCTPSFHPIGQSYPLPSSAIWVIANTLACQLCQKVGHLRAHPQLLSEGDGEVWYCWCNHQVLMSLANTICTTIHDSKKQHVPKRSITFIRNEEKAQHKPNSSGALLASARAWQIKVDLGRQLKFPENIATTLLHPGIV